LNFVTSISIGVVCALSACAASAQVSCDNLRQQVEAMRAGARDQRSGAAQMRKEGSARGSSADFIQAAKDYEEAAKRYENAAALYQEQLAACASAPTSSKPSSKRPVEKPVREASTSAPSTIEVRWGDTFSGIAATITGDARKWRELYDPQNSRLPNPDLIFAGSHFELVREANGTQYLRLVEAERGSPVATANPAAEPDTLVVGVLPNISATTLMAQYEHMKHYLEARNTQKITISTSPNFKAFFESTMNGDYDLAVSAPHFARVAQLDRGLIPLVIYEPRISALLITPADQSLASVNELRGKVIAFANPQSLVAMYGRQWLGQQGLQAGKDFEVRGPRTDLGVGRMLLTGEASAAIMSNGEFRALPPEESARLRIAETIARIPNFVVLANPRLNRALVAKLKTQLKGFLANQDDGVAFASATGITAMSDADEAQLRELDSYVEQTRSAMGVAKEGSPVASARPAAKRAPAAPTAAAAGLAQASSEEPAALVVGVLPNISATTLMAQYEHMKHYLEARNTQKITISTSPNFKAFFESTMNGDYDLAVSAPHFARVAQLDRGLIPLVIYEPRISALLITPADQSLASVNELRGKVIAFANPQSLVAMYGRQWLGQQGLQAGKDFEVRGPRTDLGVGRMLLTGEASAAIMSNGEFRALPPEESARLKIIETIARIPNFVVLANPRLNRALVARLKTQLKGFLADQDDGAAFASATGITAMSDADEAQLRELDSYAEQTRSAMGVAK
jgi:phosphonate transport system substrate-binding protein